MANSNSNSVAASIWWDSFPSFLTELESASDSSEISLSLAKKLKENRAWFLDTVNMFKPPNEKSKAALSSDEVNLGSRQLCVKAALKEKALDISSFLGLDEVQAYILVERAYESKSVVVDVTAQEFRPMMLIQYYIERQCLFKCIRLILKLDLHSENDNREGDAITDEAVKLVSDGLESKLTSLLEDQLSTNYPEQMGRWLYIFLELHSRDGCNHFKFKCFRNKRSRSINSCMGSVSLSNFITSREGRK